MVAENCQPIGKLTKLHGYEGEALLVANEDFPKKFEKTEWIFLFIVGLPVPFFISSIKMRTETSAIIKLADINSSEKMKELIGLTVFVKTTKKDKKTKQFQQFQIKGYSVVDANDGNIGIANTVLNYQENYLLQVFNNDHEILIPVNEFNIVEIDDNKRTVQVNLPEGLMELNA